MKNYENKNLNEKKNCKLNNWKGRKTTLKKYWIRAKAAWQRPDI